MQKRFVFRADASPEIGAGHVMRLCSIIEEMLERKNEVIFIGNIEGISWLEKRVESLGSKLKFLKENDFISDPRRDVLVIDSYTLDPNSKFLAIEKWHKIVALVEVGTPKYTADLYIHCGTNSKIEIDYNLNDSKFVGGIKYLPIRNSIQKIPYRIKEINLQKPPRLLIVGGGTDPNNFVGQLANYLGRTTEKFQAVLFTNELTLSRILDERFTVKQIGLDLESELAFTDLIFTLSGTSSWDYIASGFPVGIALGFENQKDNYEFQNMNGLALGIGQIDSDLEFRFDSFRIHKLLTDSKLRKDLSVSATSAVDFLGAFRIVNEILGLN